MMGAVVLAAGLGRRFGAPKVVAPVRGVPLVRHVVDRLDAGGVDEILVTIGAHADAISTAIAGTRARTVAVDAPERGMSASIVAGVEALPDACDAFLIALGDQPLIDPAVVAALRDVWERSNAAAVVPIYEGEVRGHPVLFDRSMRVWLRGLQGDRGAREVLEQMGERVLTLRVDAPVPRDIDTPGDLVGLDA